MNKLTKYNNEFIKSVVSEYANNPVITQRKLAKKYRVPLGTMVGWLTHKRNGLTPFQRYKRNRDRTLLMKWEQANARISRVRESRNRLAENYGLAQSTVVQLLTQLRNRESH